MLHILQFGRLIQRGLLPEKLVVNVNSDLAQCGTRIEETGSEEI